MTFPRRLSYEHLPLAGPLASAASCSPAARSATARPPAARPPAARARGAARLCTMLAFSLIELLIALAVAAILATLAIGGYEEHVRVTRRAEAKRTLLEAALFLEQTFALSARYDRDASGAPIASGVAPSVPPFPSALATVSAGGGPLYGIRFEEQPTPDAFTLVAVRRPDGAMANDACGDFALDHTGRRRVLRAPSGASGSSCWERGRP